MIKTSRNEGKEKGMEKKMKNKRNNRKPVICLMAALLMLSNILSACSSRNAQAPAKEETAEEATMEKDEEAATEESAETEVAETGAIESEELENAEEPAAEPTPEPTPEPVVYEGIDMESTLPGREWIGTFKDIIEEPKFVVYNDETNKKVIVENGQKVEFAGGDTLAVYTPGKMYVFSYDGNYIKKTYGYGGTHCTDIIFEDNTTMIDNNTISAGITVFGGSNDDMVEITCTLVPAE